jgi:hypothetical protein
MYLQNFLQTYLDLILKFVHYIIPVLHMVGYCTYEFNFIEQSLMSTSK